MCTLSDSGNFSPIPDLPTSFPETPKGGYRFTRNDFFRLIYFFFFFHPENKLGMVINELFF